MVKLLAVMALGSLASLSAPLAQTVSSSSDLGPFLSAGGGMTAVAALAVMARYMAQGKLVSRDVETTQTRLMAIIEADQELAREGHMRERELMDMLRYLHGTARAREDRGNE